jgi:hypothetical protein
MERNGKEWKGIEINTFQHLSTPFNYNLSTPFNHYLKKKLINKITYNGK